METGNHFAHPEHQLFLSHADEDDGRLCNNCQEPVRAGPTFACVEGCRFYLHQRCADLPEQINHPCHDHPLQFNSGGSYACNVCRKVYQSSRYRCDACEFDVDLACSKLELKPLVRFEDGKHLFFLFRDIKFQHEYDCDVCGQRCDKDLPVMSCVKCWSDGHQRHVHCTPIELPSEVRHDRDIHPLVLKARLVGNHTGEYFCLVCGRTMRAHRPAYCCEMCNHIAHVTCLALEELPPLITISEGTGRAITIRLREQQKPDDEPSILSHFSHPQHRLRGTWAFPGDGTGSLCNVCRQTILGGPVFACSELCFFYIHEHCGHLPEQINHPCHDHPLQLLPKAFDGTGWSRCDVCKNPDPGFTYRCVECNFNLDISCSTLDFKPIVTYEENGHFYCLFQNHKFAEEDVCEVCNTRCYEDIPVMGCVYCVEGHRRHVHCLPIEFPREVKHRHIHPLVFKERFVEDGDWDEYACDACERSRDVDHPVYCCDHPDCSVSNYIAHVTCVVPLEELPALINKPERFVVVPATTTRLKQMRELTEKLVQLETESSKLRRQLEMMESETEETKKLLAQLRSGSTSSTLIGAAPAVL